MADGTKLPCVVIFKGLKNVPKGRFPNDVIVEVNEKGFMTAEMLSGRQGQEDSSGHHH